MYAATIVAVLLSPQVSWAKGSKKAVLGGDDIRLPSLLAPDAVGQAVPFWVRFVGDPKEWPGAHGLTCSWTGSPVSASSTHA
jgi:hypothetical protein